MASTHAVTLATYLEDSAEKFPDRIAVVGPSGRSLTFRELDERASRIAGFLQSRGVRPSDRVGVMLPKGIDSISVIFGVEKARAAYVPADYSGPADRCGSIFHDCEVKLLFLADSRRDLVGGAAHQLSPDRLVFVAPPGSEPAPVPAGATRFAEVLEHPPGRSTRTERALADLAYILYTSGSTGVPKGVMLTQENATSFVDWCSDTFHPDPEDRFSSHAPFHFDLSVLDLYVPMKHGATLYVVSEELGKDPRKLSRFIAEHRLTVWYSTPSILGLLAEFGSLEQLDCASLRLVLFAGEVFPVKRLRHLTQLWPHPAYFNLYGPTETNVCTYAPIPLPVPEDRTEPYPIGPACEHCRPLVLDDEDGTEVVRGEEGLLYMTGASIFSGYWNRPERNAAAFIERGGERYYNTGDVVREDPELGFIYLGRRDRMVKRRGYRIELGEVETALNRHPELREAAVVALPDAEAGVKICAHLVAAGEKKPGIISLKKFCAENLLSYMSPDLFRFHDALPRTSTDKIDYQSLKKSS